MLWYKYSLTIKKYANNNNTPIMFTQFIAEKLLAMGYINNHSYKNIASCRLSKGFYEGYSVKN